MTMDEVEERNFGHIRLAGGRYESPGLPVSTAVELLRYERLISTVAHHLYMRSHPKRKRAPRGFRELLDLRLVDVRAGSVIPVVTRARGDGDEVMIPGDWHDQARRLINEALTEVNTSLALPRTFPVQALKEFASFGRSLQDNERIELSGEGEDTAILTPDTRRRIQSLANLKEIEVELPVQGQVIGLHSDPQRFDLLLITEGRRKIVGEYSDPAMWDTLYGFQGYAERAPLAALSVVARQGLDGELRGIVDVLSIEAALPPEWAARINQLSRLSQGWLYPESETPSRDVLDETEDFLLACVDESLPRPKIFPSAEGGVQLEWRTPGRTVEVELLNEGTARVFALDMVADDDHEFELETDTEELLELVKGALRV